MENSKILAANVLVADFNTSKFVSAMGQPYIGQWQFSL